jgi:spore maturation protein CgeB
MVLEKHTYDNRVDEIVNQLVPAVKSQRRFALKIGAPNRAVAHEWGDYHFAESLRNALVELGHVARIDCLDVWDSPDCYTDDCAIVLRGLSSYKAKPYQCNIMWVISHPDLISRAEYESYDIIFTASAKHQAHLNAQNIPAHTLLQCTDQHRFNPGSERMSQLEKAIFIGNTRNVYRNVVKYAVESGIELNVIGAGWRDFIPGSYVIDDFIKNARVADRYRSAEFVLNDHWESMRTWGFVSNRVFDVIACGTPCLSDLVEGMSDIFGEAVVTYSGKADFESAVSLAKSLRERPNVLMEASDRILSGHTFSERAKTILRRFEMWENCALNGGSLKNSAEVNVSGSRTL